MATISQRLRFEVFKRDKFTCQYCGQQAPDVILNCDHIKPLADGGETDLLNLITSCRACNGGKGAVPLTDASALHRQRSTLADLEERRRQIEMML
jgi:5-methylcytosine-specific restriction endonuclease McrA